MQSDSIEHEASTEELRAEYARLKKLGLERYYYLELRGHKPNPQGLSFVDCPGCGSSETIYGSHPYGFAYEESYVCLLCGLLFEGDELYE
jgi:DNA-directed RNA polymerase subunit RPC12/RpoP